MIQLLFGRFFSNTNGVKCATGLYNDYCCGALWGRNQTDYISNIYNNNTPLLLLPVYTYGGMIIISYYII